MLSYLPRAIALFALASFIAASAARADDYPSRPVKMVASDCAHQSQNP